MVSTYPVLHGSLFYDEERLCKSIVSVTLKVGGTQYFKENRTLTLGVSDQVLFSLCQGLIYIQFKAIFMISLSVLVARLKVEVGERTIMAPFAQPRGCRWI